MSVFRLFLLHRPFTSAASLSPSTPPSPTPHRRYTLDDETHFASHISMIAGGTGITPMYQVIQAVLKGSRAGRDATRLSLLYANVSPDDILLRDELDALAAAHPDSFKVWYTGAVGRLNRSGEGGGGME